MKRELAFLSFALLGALSAGCGESKSDDGDNAGSSGSATGGTGGSTGGTAGTGAPACDGMLTANPVNNYSFSSTLSFPPVSVQPDTELTFDWSAVTTDFLGHGLDPMGGIDTVSLILWKLTQGDLETKLNADDLQMRNVAVIATYYTQKMATDATAFEFTSVGMPLTPCEILPFLQAPNPDPMAHPECPGWAENVGNGWDPATHSYTVMIASGTELGQGTHMIQGFKLDPASTNTRVELTPTSTHLEYTVDLEALQPTRVPAAMPGITLEWGGMTVNALGNTFIPTSITRAVVAHYTESISELEPQFLDLNVIPADRWRGEIVEGTSAALSSFTNETGELFPGIDETGTWIVALVCGNCRNPAPWYMSVLRPCAP